MSTKILKEYQRNAVDELKVNYVVQYRYIIKKLIEKLDIEIDVDAFNGGKNRAKFYFKYYYYPLKVLESRGIINFYGRGRIERIK